MNNSKQKLILEFLLSSNDLFARCSNIIKSNYFDPEYRGLVKFISDYYENHKGVPSFPILKGEYPDIDLEKQEITKDTFSYISEEIEKFAKHSGIVEAIRSSFADIENENYDFVVERVKEATSISLDRDLGVDLYENIEDNIKKALEALAYIPSQIDVLDEALGGGFARKQFTLFSANSGVGKSIMLANLANYYSLTGYNVLVISLELSQSMIYSRLGSISTGVSMDDQLQKISLIVNRLENYKEAGAGSLRIKRLKNGACANDVRAFLKQYEIALGHTPDVIIMDYLDLMTPNGGRGTLSISEQDKLKSEQMYEIGNDFDAIVFSASQQNREALRMSSPDQGVIAGGITKVNTVDNYISLHMTPQMRLEGIMILHFLKSRSASAVGKSVAVSFNANNLRITDLRGRKAETYLKQFIKEQEKNNKGGGPNLGVNVREKSFFADENSEDDRGEDLLGFIKENVGD